MQHSTVSTKLIKYYPLNWLVHNLTICIAAICENKYVVVTTDRMLTLLIPNIEYEADYQKSVEIAKNCVVATAGSAIALTPILQKVKTLTLQSPAKDIPTLAEQTRLAYEQVRNEKLNEEILSSYGLNLQSFYQANMALNQQLMALLIQRMQQYNYNLWVLLAGVDDNGGHIFRIENPAVKYCYDSIGYHAIGSGEIHAAMTFIANDFKTKDTPLNRGLTLSYEAKRRSEKAQGVGAQTDMTIVMKDGIKRVPDDVITRLDSIYQKRVEQEKKAVSEAEQMIRDLDLKKIIEA